MPVPIKRHQSLQPLSRDHHDALLLCWKIRKGISKNVEAKRIQQYVDWFITEHLLPHFKMEEEYVFTLAQKNNPNVQQAIAEHAALVKLFNTGEKNYILLKSIADLLEAHIRFEERVLFNEIQSIASEEQLHQVTLLHNGISFCENEADVFWK